MDALGIVIGNLVLMWAAGWALSRLDPPPNPDRARRGRMIAWGGSIWRSRR